MFQYTFTIILFFISWKFSTAQNEIFTGSLDTKASSNILTHVDTDENYYYFANGNIDGPDRTISLFKTTTDFEIVDSIENLKIRGFATSILSLFKVLPDKILMISNASTETGTYTYTHSFDLDFNKHTIIDSIRINSGEQFFAYEYKFLDKEILYAIGNKSIFNFGGTLSTHFIELNTKGQIAKFETIRNHREQILTFDYNPTTAQYIIAENNELNLVNSNLEIVDTYLARLPVPIPNSTSLIILIGSCQYLENGQVECIASSLGPAEIYSNLSAYFSTDQDSIQYQDIVALHPDTVDNDRTRLVFTTEDEEGNRYFAYHEPFNPIDGVAEPNKVFISKFDKDFNNLYFLELLDTHEHGFENVTVDQQGNFLIVGASTPPDNANVFTNSYIKISENGQLLTSTGSIFQPEIIDVYPNPATDFITLHIDQPSTDIYYSIYTVDGRLAAQGNISSGTNLEVNTQSLPTGIYILNVEYDGFIKIAKFVK